jgi:uncharacterized protein YutE (UPF0331/DUF86 family)
VNGKINAMEPLVEVLRRQMPLTGRDLDSDLERRLTVERALGVVVDLAVSINSHVAKAGGGQQARDYHDSFLVAARVGTITTELAERLAPHAGLRSALAHRYDEIDLDRVAAAVPLVVEGFDEYVRQTSVWLTQQEDR